MADYTHILAQDAATVSRYRYLEVAAVPLPNPSVECPVRASEEFRLAGKMASHAGHHQADSLCRESSKYSVSK